MMSSALGSKVWIIVMITYVIAISGFSHVVAGSTEACLVWPSGSIGLGKAILGFILAALVGNTVGATRLFAAIVDVRVLDAIMPG